MRLLFVLALLPLIGIVSWLASPILIALWSIVKVAERIRASFGAFGELAFFEMFVVLTVLSFQSRKFFWFGLLPVVAATVFLARS